MSYRTAKWCALCRDEGGRDEMIACVGCKKRFHTFCLLEHAVVAPGELLDSETWLCDACSQEEEDVEYSNDEQCKVCREEKLDEADLLLLCDGCPNSYHVSCLGLEAEPDVEKWYCPECKPQDHKAQDIRRLGSRSLPADASSDHVNSTSCYVCQQPGKLLGCDSCEKSFHPSCLPDVEFNNIVDIWQCPVCKGDDPLDRSHTRFKRMNQKERHSMKVKREKAIQQMRAKCSKYRNRFILANSKILEPFVNSKIFESVRRRVKNMKSSSKRNESGGSTSSKKNKGGKNFSKLGSSRVVKDDDDQDHDSDNTGTERDNLDDMAEGANKDVQDFIEKCYSKCRIIRNRQMQGPLRKGISLKNYQVEGVEWLLKSFLKGGGILADEMGLGKTIQTLCFLSYLKAGGVEGPHLIVVPLSTVGNWLREVHKFTPNLTTVKICGSKCERDHAMRDTLASNGLYDLYITTYETVKTEESFFTDTVAYWQCIVLDEAHRIKNQSGAMRHSLDRVRGNTRILLTGTPMQNNAQELFTLINFLFPDLFGSKMTALVESAFMGPTTTTGSTLSNGGGNGGNSSNSGSHKRNLASTSKSASEVKPEYITAVRSLLEKIMLRRVKEQAIVLPKKIFHDIWVPISKTSVRWYKLLIDLSSTQALETSVRKMLGIVIKLRILCCHPRGLVARQSQFLRLQQAFAEETDELRDSVMKEAEDLRSTKGEKSISSSSKTTFLDVLLRQLHYENIKNVPGYHESYLNHRRQLAVVRYHARQDVLEQEARAEGRLTKSALMRKKTIDAIIKTEEFKQFELDGIPPNAPTANVPDYLAKGLWPATILATPTDCTKIHEESEKKKKVKEGDGQCEDDLSPDGSDIGNKTFTTERNISRASTGSTASNKENLKIRGRTLSIEQNAGQTMSPEDVDDIPSREGEEDEDTTVFEQHKGDESITPLDKEPISIETISIQRNETLTSSNNNISSSNTKGQQDEKSSFGGTVSPPSSSKANGPMMHKVLIFTQFQLVLDELSRYCDYRGWKYMRLDGSTNKLIRELDIREFSLDTSSHFVYLISTRAGGLGINLTKANHVVLFDEDWNPFVDLQAIDRAHRIGQQREVHIWKVTTEWTVEERMALRREQKLKLDRMLIQANEELYAVDEDNANAPEEKLSTEEIKKLLSHGKEAIKKLEVDAQQFEGMKLEDFVERHRKPLPEGTEIEDDEEEGEEEDGYGSESEIKKSDLKKRNGIDLGKGVYVSVDEVMHDEVEEPDYAHKDDTKGDLKTGLEPSSSRSTNSQPLTKGEPPSPSPVFEDETLMAKSGMTTGTKNQDDWMMKPELNQGKCTGSFESAGGLVDSIHTTERSCGEGDCNIEEKTTPSEIESSTPTLEPRKVMSLESELESAGVVWRSERRRRKPATVYVPATWGVAEAKKKLIYESRCFTCSRPRNAKVKYMDKTQKEVEVDYGELIGCARCPKAYHKLCEGMKDEKKTWCCRWHECCLCFRKASQCGNLLIHCARCPTSFCYDCFPPDYTRYQVEEEYYHQLRQRGATMSSSNWILFLCARCKAIEEQEKRRALTRAELEEQRQKQKELRAQLGVAQKEAASSRTSGAGSSSSSKCEKWQKTEEQQRKIISRRNEIDALEGRLESDLRDAYEALFPQEVVTILREYKKKAEEERSAQRTANFNTNNTNVDGVSQQTDGSAATPISTPAPTTPGTDSQIIGKEEEKPAQQITKEDESDNNQQVNSGSERMTTPGGVTSNSTTRRKSTIPRIMLPRELLKVCCNCHFPFHSHPVEYVEEQKGDLPRCPYPPETLQFRAVLYKPNVQLGKNYQRLDKNPEPPEGVPENQFYHNRSFCSLCGCGQKGRVGHCRRHCDRLTAEQITEYVTRYARCTALIEKLRAGKRIEVTMSGTSLAKTRSVLNSLLPRVNLMVKTAMVEVGLGHCIVLPNSPTITNINNTIDKHNKNITIDSKPVTSNSISRKPPGTSNSQQLSLKGFGTFRKIGPVSTQNSIAKRPREIEDGISDDSLTAVGENNISHDNDDPHLEGGKRSRKYIEEDTAAAMASTRPCLGQEDIMKDEDIGNFTDKDKNNSSTEIISNQLLVETGKNNNTSRTDLVLYSDIPSTTDKKLSSNPPIHSLISTGNIPHTISTEQTSSTTHISKSSDSVAETTNTQHQLPPAILPSSKNDQLQ